MVVKLADQCQGERERKAEKENKFKEAEKGEL